MAYIIDNVYNSCEKSLGGITSLFVKSRDDIGDWYYSETSTKQFGEIIGNSGTTTWYNFESYLKDLNFTETLTQPATPRLYTQSLTVKVYPKSIDQRDQLERFLVNRNLVIVFLDNNGRYWVFGETFGSTVDYSATTDVENGINGYNITFNALERAPIRSLSQTYVDTYINFNTPDFLTLCAEDLDELCRYDLNKLCEIPLN